jgi:hypothetical protein
LIKPCQTLFKQKKSLTLKRKGRNNEKGPMSNKKRAIKSANPQMWVAKQNNRDLPKGVQKDNL